MNIKELNYRTHLETENTLVRRPETIEYAYNQLESVLMGHRNVLKATTGAKAAHAYAPDEDTPETPVIQTTGDVYKKLFKFI